jgi:gliding motility-associated-like protein
MYRRIVCFCLLLLSSFTATAQKEVYRWYFGYNAGINFNTTPASLLTDGQTYTREGVATICDGSTGDLLFYTEGSTVWNAKHKVMPDGTGLQGDPSSSQSGVVVPFPGHPGQYYLFTTMTDKGFRYNLVDMALDNGMGDIVPGTKNTALLSNNLSTEKIGATRHCNGRDFWVITHAVGNANYYVYLVTSAGISAPTVYTTGSVIHSGGWEEAGVLKFSDDGGTLVHTLAAMQQGQMSKVDLLKFNNATGVLSAPFETLNIVFPLGSDFSSDGKLLYVVSMNYMVWSRIYQYDLTAANVNASQVIVANVTVPLQIGGVQMGPDRRMYVGYEKGDGYRYVGLIHKPDVKGTGCNFEQDAMDMDPTGQGLRRTSVCFPTFVKSFLYVPADFTVSTICDGKSTFKLVNDVGVTSVLWDFGDGTTSTQLSPEHLYASNKTYTVKVTVTAKCSTNEKTSKVVIEGKIGIAVTKFICDGSTYVLPDGKTINAEGTYISTIKRARSNCDSVITTTVKFSPVYNKQENAMICMGQEYQLADGRKVSTSGTYVSSFKTYLGCDSLFTTTLKVLQPTDFTVSNVCEGKPAFKLVDEAGITGVLWDFGDGSTSAEMSPEHIYASENKYTVKVTVTGRCSNDEKIHQVLSEARIQRSVSQSICTGDSYLLPDGTSVNTAGAYVTTLKRVVSGCDSVITTTVKLLQVYKIKEEVIICGGQSYQLPDGRSVNSNGTYVSSLKTYQGCDSVITTTVKVMLAVHREMFDTACNGHPYTLPDGKQVFTANTYTSKLLTTHGCDSIITTHLSLKEKPQVTMEPEVCLYAGQAVTITLPPGFDKYVWENGTTGNVHVLRFPGLYRVDVMNECGTTTLQTVAKDCAVDLYIPTAFTPNGDGQNDIFRLVRPYGQMLLEFRVFNRWGLEVFSTTDLLKGWDGTFKGLPQPVGSYVYIIRYKNRDGIEKQLNGAVHLLR